MLKRKQTVGSPIEAWCGSCKSERAHTISAMAEGTVRTVTCDHCKSLHRYRAAGVPATARRRASSPSAKANGAQRVVRHYARHERYAVGELIEHPQYGRGTITEVPDPTKIRIKFSDGVRTFLQAMSS